MANLCSAMCTVSGKPHHLWTDIAGISDFYLTKRNFAMTLFFRWLKISRFVKKPAWCLGNLRKEIGNVKIIKKLNKVPAIEFIFPAIVIIHTIVTLTGISFGLGNKKLAEIKF